MPAREFRGKEEYKGIPSEEPPAESNIRGVLEESRGMEEGIPNKIKKEQNTKVLICDKH